MSKKKEEEESCCEEPSQESCCNVEAVLTVDERGQMVLPKELRKQADIKAGDKLALVSLHKENKFCCFMMLKVDSLSSAVKDMLQPIMKEI
jgi:AbrB family looped-hinge helix DNA binding protein